MFSSRTVRAVTALLAIRLLEVRAFDTSLYDNVAVYWGQDSYGSTSSNSADYQQPISYYCQDDAIDMLMISSVDVFFSTGGLPEINLANTCNADTSDYFSGTQLFNCSFLGPDIEYCQQQGKAVTISLGGAAGAVGFDSDDEATAFADTIWDLFLGGSSDTRPFGDAILDGIDLDIEGGSTTGYAAFISQIRSHYTGASKEYYVSASPQCQFPDPYLGPAFETEWFDMVFVQFYNNPCGLQEFGTADWDYGVWNVWAETASVNPNVKIYIGAPASSTAANSGYEPIGTLSSDATTTRNSFPAFGGVMLWDASQAYQNDRYDLAIKEALQAAGSTGFDYPPCSAPEYVSGTGYAGGYEVSYNGYIWLAAYYASDTPTAVYAGDWSPVSACSGSASGGSGSTTTPPPSSSSSSSSSSPTSTPVSGGSCSGVPEWSSGSVYVGGDQAQYDGDLWTAMWWTEDDVPGGAAGVWTNDGACSADIVARATPAVGYSRFFRL